MKRILIADDSALVRKQITEIVAELGFEIDTARNGAEAVEKALASQYDVITMDINMPIMDGLTAVRKIMERQPTPILMISSLTTESAQVTMEALDAGAVDYIAKPGTMNVGRDENSADIVQKVKSLSRIPPRRLKTMTRRSVVRERPQSVREATRMENQSTADVTKLLLIGASTGGPGRIEQICTALPATFAYAVCIVQHMPEQFTAAFATRLDKNSSLPVIEAKDHMELYPGNIYLARGGVHMHFGKKVTGRVVIREEKNKGSRFFQPSVDEMFLSALKVFSGDQIVGVLLTGIGDDGAMGMVALKQAGGFTIGESEETATVYGMPKEAYDRGGVSQQLPFPKIIRALQTLR
ncbi:MAG TPA: chemotaxis-specific protein-glutamate methyltransferase CheB [Sulfuricurvum sp.]|nr:MAG: chemotaxis response regulator protein-glutamate methylesterase [Campylobacterales bacterium 16-40-21]OZA02492.1 MAG: chemotaxis response regulator protein-glutamate methylesterase [Sulfuricurvum sp. 17-40-25]HQS67332.1 chemotaxis-specific protein-glutamate methyltransferase CheB [Sulfuricurvum sp.]HQT36083.1 chemotaxis-specific protein-glutamate methyltransferase CheB [Sulfuricurvum sp.]